MRIFLNGEQLEIILENLTRLISQFALYVRLSNYNMAIRAMTKDEIRLNVTLLDIKSTLQEI